MKLIHQLSNPFIRGSGWVCRRFPRILSLRPRRLAGGDWLQPVPVSDANLCWAGESAWFNRTDARTPESRTRLYFSQQSPPDTPRAAPSPENGVGRGSGSSTEKGGQDPVARISSVNVDELLQEVASRIPRDLSPVRKRHRDRAMTLLGQETVLEAAYCSHLVPLETAVEAPGLRVAGQTLPAPVKLPKKGEMTALGCVAGTLGPRFESRVSQLFSEKCGPLALALESLGNELLLALSRRMVGDLLATAGRDGLTLGQRLEFAQSESDFHARDLALRLAGAEAIGIRRHEAGLLWPPKSHAAVFAVGYNLPKLSVSRYLG